MTTLNPNSFVDQIRLNVGDTNKDDPYMPDHIYMWYYTTNGESVIEASIAALESLINQVALNPSAWDVGNVGARIGTVEALERRLQKLKLRTQTAKAPVVIHSDRKNWNDFNKLFGDC